MRGEAERGERKGDRESVGVYLEDEEEKDRNMK